MGVFSFLILWPKFRSDLLKERVFLSEVLLGEILGNQIGKNAIFHIKKSPFYKTTEFAVSAWRIDQKTPENPQKLVKMRLEIQYFWKIHSLK